MHHPDLIVGPQTLDDAGVFRLDPSTALVLTLDFFPPIVDDPVWYGRIAAANALSDVYAMGGRPITAMNIVGFPAELPVSILGEILKGGAEKVIEAGAIVVGGHSVRDTEIKFGLSVTGLVHPDRVVSNARARPGDVLILTKPLGMGAAATAIKRELLDGGAAEAACAQMATLNKGACTAMLEAGVVAATDVTGFGLMGHGRGMAEASGVTLEFESARLPLFTAFGTSARELSERGLTSGGAVRTRKFLGAHAEVAAGIPDAVAKLAFDAETSGGMLIAVAADRADCLIAALRREATPCAAIVGRVLDRRGEVRVRLA